MGTPNATAVIGDEKADQTVNDVDVDNGTVDLAELLSGMGDDPGSDPEDPSRYEDELDPAPVNHGCPTPDC